MLRFCSICILLLGTLILFPSAIQGPAMMSEWDTLRSRVHPTDDFGIESGLFTIDSSRIARNETLSEILGRYSVSPGRIAALAEEARPLIDVRRMVAGKPYYAYQSDEDDLEYLVYQQNVSDFIVFDFSDSIAVRSGSLPIETRMMEARGVINGSLYETLLEQQANPMVAIELSEVLAWQVDFYRIMKGDAFHLIYEEEFIDEQSTGVTRILAVQFAHQQENFYGFRYEQDDFLAYYDEKGQGLRRPFLRAPLQFSRISSRYSGRRFHPVLKTYRSHLGTDYAAPTGTPVRATADGTVVEAGYTKGNGRWVKIRHNGTYSSGYLHLSRIATGISKGVRIEQGQTIGYVGSSGLATGPHLCYRFWKNGQQVDALAEKLPETSKPIPGQYRRAFELQKNMYLSLLNLPEPAAPETAQNDT